MVDNQTKITKIKVEPGAYDHGRLCEPVPLSKYQDRDQVTVFGLPACDTNQFDFFGYIVVVE